MKLEGTEADAMLKVCIERGKAIIHGAKGERFGGGGLPKVRKFLKFLNLSVCFGVH